MIELPDTSAYDDALAMLEEQQAEWAAAMGEGEQEAGQEVEFHGAAARYLECDDKEVLLDSGAGTGKSFSGMWKMRLCAELYPYSVQIFARQTRKSMSTTVLPDWEHDVLGRGHPAINGTATLDHRDKYVFPNGSEVWLLGLENIDRVLSAKVDRVYIPQAEEMPTSESWEKLISRLRNRRTPYHQATADVNPADEFHWLNLRPEMLVCVKCREADPDDPDALPKVVDLDENGACPRCSGTIGVPRMTRINYRPKDNPALYDPRKKAWTDWGREYVGEILGSLTGLQKLRLVDHLWVSKQGQIWEGFDSAVHLYTGTTTYDRESMTWQVRAPEFGDHPRVLTWFSSSMDFGTRNPGCFQCWGHDREGRAYLVAEIYRRGKAISWWGERIAEIYEEFPFRNLATDSADGGIGAAELLNDALYGRGLPRRAHPVDKGAGKLFMLDLVAQQLAVGPDGTPARYFDRNSLRHRDQDLSREGRPVSTVQEIPSYIWEETADGRPIKERPDATCADHGCDAMQYDAITTHKMDLTPPQPEPAYVPGQAGFYDDPRKVLANGRTRTQRRTR